MTPTVGSYPVNAAAGQVPGFGFIVVQYLPIILAAIIVFIVGWMIGMFLYSIIISLARILHLDAVMRASGLSGAAERAGFTLDIGKFLGLLVMWFVVLAFLSASLDILGLSRVTLFFEEVILLYIPQVIVAALILVLAAVLADLVQKLITHSARMAGAHKGAHFAGTVAKWAIWTLAILGALDQLGVAIDLVRIVFGGLVLALSVAFGLAFGLGGRDAAARMIEHVRTEISHH